MHQANTDIPEACKICKICKICKMLWPLFISIVNQCLTIILKADYKELMAEKWLLSPGTSSWNEGYKYSKDTCNTLYMSLYMYNIVWKYIEYRYFCNLLQLLLCFSEYPEAFLIILTFVMAAAWVHIPHRDKRTRLYLQRSISREEGGSESLSLSLFSLPPIFLLLRALFFSLPTDI